MGVAYTVIALYVVCIFGSAVIIHIWAPYTWGLDDLAESLHFLCFCSGAVVDCIDREGHHVRSGERFAPDEDPCKTCYCVDGIAQLCTLVQCSPPSCPKWEPISNKCCNFRCLDRPQLIGGNNKSSQGNFYMSVHFKNAAFYAYHRMTKLRGHIQKFGEICVSL